MQDIISTINTWLPILFVIFCILPAIFMAVIFYFVYRGVRSFTEPDQAKMQARYAKMRAANPRLSDEKLVRRVIKREAMKCGVVGAVTSFGGFVTLPIALPVDFVLSTRIQAQMVQFIATHYGHNNPSATEQRLQTYLIMTGSRRFTQTTTSFFINFAMRFAGKWVVKLVPFIGAIIGFVVNYTFARTVGNTAHQWYHSRAAKRIISEAT